jgi:hypothetical protein
MSFDVTQFGLGLAGALVTLYIAKDEVLPEFRAFYDTTDREREAAELRKKLSATETRIDAITSNLDGGGLTKQNSDDLHEALRSHQADAAAWRERLKSIEAKVDLKQFVSRSLGFAFYVGLGGVFGWLLADEVNIDGIGANLQALLIGATWTTYVSSVGFRAAQSRVKERVDATLDDVSKKIDAAKQDVARSVSQQVAEAEKSDPVDQPQVADRVALEVAEKMDTMREAVQENLTQTRKEAARDFGAAL